MATANTTTTAGITKAAFSTYAAKHLGTPLRNLRGAYKRRRAAVCKALGLTVAAFEARAAAVVAALVGTAAKYLDKALAYSFVANRLEASLVAEAPKAVAVPMVEVVRSKPANDNATVRTGSAAWVLSAICSESGDGYCTTAFGSQAEVKAAADELARATGWRVAVAEPGGWRGRRAYEEAAYSSEAV